MTMRSDEELAYQLALRDEERRLLDRHDGDMRHPTLRKGLVSQVAPLEIDGAPAGDWTSAPLTVGQPIIYLVDTARRFAIGVHDDGSDQGSNTNGEWVRQPGGLLICTATLTVPGTSDPFVWTFPAPFAAVPFTIQATVATTTARFATISTGGTSATQAAVRVWDTAGSIDGTDRSVRLFAYGPE
jgi:hypothetical protein